MGSRKELEQCQNLVTVFFDLGYSDSADNASRLAGLCIAEDLVVLPDFKGLESMKNLPSFSEHLQAADMAFLDECIKYLACAHLTKCLF